MSRTLLRVRQLAEKQPALSEGSIRWLIFKSKENGLYDSGAVLRNGRTILIDEGKFFSWLDSRHLSGARLRGRS